MDRLPEPTTSSRRVEAVITYTALATGSGAVAGLLWGGIGGRIAMRVLFLTSSPLVRGLTSDDGFEIGTISGATVFLLIFGTFVGGVAGFVFGLLRSVLAGPVWLIASGLGIASAMGVGAAIVNTDGIDFRLLEPLWLAVALFVFIPGAWGVTVVLLVERLLRVGPLFSEPQPRFDPGYWGLAGWVLLVAMTIAGVLDLVSDVSELS